VTAVDAMRMVPAILSFTGRMNDLRTEGHLFERAGRRDKCVVWRLLQPTSAPSIVPDPLVPASDRNGANPPQPPGEPAQAPKHPCERQGSTSLERLPGLAPSHYDVEVRG
jgi:hypothetical protein